MGPDTILIQKWNPKSMQMCSKIFRTMFFSKTDSSPVRYVYDCSIEVPETYLEPSQTSTMELFAKIGNAY